MVRKSSSVYFRILLKFTSFYDGVTFLFSLLPTEAQKNLVGMFYIRQKKMSPKLEHLVVNWLSPNAPQLQQTLSGEAEI